jgi:hypothetical protein
VIRLLVFLLLSLSLRAETLLVITEPTARGYLGTLLQEWASQVRAEGRYTRVIIREAQRYTQLPGSSSARWASIAIVSNLIDRHQPDAVQFVGAIPFYLGGGFNEDGHYTRCAVTDAPYMATNVSFTDTLSWGMDNSTYLASNEPGDGRFDNLNATGFARPVARISAAVIGNSASNVFGSGCLIGLYQTPEVNEATALRAYFTNNLAYRRGLWTTSATGMVTGPLYGSSAINFISTNASQLSWVSSLGAIGGGSKPRMMYHSWDNSEMNNLYDGSCNAARALFMFIYRSYMFEVYDTAGYANGTTRMLFPGRTTEPYALVAGWTHGNTATTYWISRPSDTHVADMVRSSVSQAGAVSFFYWLAGDVTLNVDGTATQMPLSSVTTLQTR